MPNYMVDSIRQAFTATGIVEPLMEWEETPDGSRRKSKDRQAHHELTGMPMWDVEVMYLQSAWGSRTTVTAKVQVAAEHKPKPRALGPIGFNGLQVDISVNRKTGGFREYWSAESLIEASPSTSTKPANEKAA